MRMIVLGKTQSGKTYYVYNKIYRNYANDHYLIFIDPKPTDYVNPITKNGKIIHSIRDIKRYNKFKELSDNREVIMKGTLTLDYDFEDEVELFFNELIRLVSYSKYKSKILIVVDEAHRFSTKHSYMRALGKLVKEGESHNISTILILQHPSELSNVLIANCEYALLFGNNPLLYNYYEKNLSLDLTEFHEWLNVQYNGVLYDYKSIEKVRA